MPDSYCHFHIVRHAQSEGNVKGIVQGHADYPLTELGRTQAQSCSIELSTIAFDDAFSSDLLRTVETAEIIATKHQIAVTSTQLLREQNFGKFNGASVQMFEDKLDALLAKHRSLALEQRFSHRAHPEIESDEEMMTRMIPFLRSTALTNLDKNILIVSHGSIMRTLLVRLGYATFEQLTHSAIGNCGYIKLDSDGVDFFIRSTHGVTVGA